MGAKVRYIIVFLIITNIATLILYLNKPSNNNLVLKMSGQSKNWVVKDYEIAYLTDYYWYESGNPNITFLGDAGNIEQFKFTEYCILINGEQPQGSSGGTNFENGIFMSSGGGSELPKHVKRDYLKQINENTYFIIEWTEYSGEKKSERVDLKIDISLKQTKKLVNEQ